MPGNITLADTAAGVWAMSVAESVLVARGCISIPTEEMEVRFLRTLRRTTISVAFVFGVQISCHLSKTYKRRVVEELHRFQLHGLKIQAFLKLVYFAGVAFHA